MQNAYGNGDTIPTSGVAIGELVQLPENDRVARRDDERDDGEIREEPQVTGCSSHCRLRLHAQSKGGYASEQDGRNANASTRKRVMP